MLQKFSCSILQNKLRNIRIVLVPRCQNATCCVAIALHLIPTAKVTCRAKGWRTSEHTTSTAKMILSIYILSSIYCFITFLYFFSRISLCKAMLDRTSWPHNGHWAEGNMSAMKTAHLSSTSFNQNCHPNFRQPRQSRNVAKSLKHASFVSVAMPPVAHAKFEPRKEAFIRRNRNRFLLPIKYESRGFVYSCLFHLCWIEHYSWIIPLQTNMQRLL